MLTCFFACAILVAEPSGSFAEKVVPIFQKRCLACHNDVEKKGSLSLQSKETAFQGESGQVIAPGKPKESYLVQLIRPESGKAEMPKEADPLSKSDVDAVVRWIDDGAKWPDGYRIEEPVVAAGDWWSLKPIERPKIPVPRSPAKWQRSPIDAFVAAKQKEVGLHHSTEADRRTLARRLSFDLLGLSPDFADIPAFEADPAPDAYDRLVDRMLASPRLGERWARHWLDVVHFGETHGYDKDKPRFNAWPYRDYVIRAFNEDKAYPQFVREQIAGDVLYPNERDAIEALGFLAAGPWDFIGHAELPETKIDGKIARHLDRDDFVANTINTFCSLTVHCAQCHNHKFDPISQEDYYRLQAVFAAIDRADKEYDLDPSVAQRRAALSKKKANVSEQLSKIQEEIVARGGEELKAFDDKIAAGRKEVIPAEHGYHSQIEASPDLVKWVQVDLGQMVAIDRIVLVACHDDFNGIGAGFGFPPRFRIELADDAEFQTNVVVVVDNTSSDFANPKTKPISFDVARRMGRFVRLTATRLAPRQNDYILALAELEVLDAQAKNVARGKDVSALDSIEAPERWAKSNLVDGIYPRTAISETELASLESARQKLLEERVGATLLKEKVATQAALSKIEANLASLPAPSVVYAGVVHTGSGSFVGTGATGGKPRPIHILSRGDVTRPGKEVGPGAIAAVAELSAAFELSENHSEGQRRSALADWIADERHPLTWRSIVNRVWMYHLGRGIVDTPNDFGRMGQLPTHPELLDWLAMEFRDTGGSLKSMHRMIVTSATYRQASADDPSLAQVDVDNRYYWRANRRRLEAEAIRDSILLAAGRLDLSMGGPSFQNFVIDKPEHSPHYEYQLHDPDDPKSHRRSVYRFLVRSQQQPFMVVMDCADPSMLVEKRNQTISPLQALALWNNRLTLTMAKHFAKRVQMGTGGSRRAGPSGTPVSLQEQVKVAFQIALCRQPTDPEAESLTDYAAQYGLVNACRVILNLNEFVFVD